MRGVWSFVVAVLAFVVVAAPTVVLADGRVALVVGNSTYTHIGRLPNPTTTRLTCRPRCTGSGSR